MVEKNSIRNREVIETNIPSTKNLFELTADYCADAGKSI